MSSPEEPLLPRWLRKCPQRHLALPHQHPRPAASYPTAPQPLRPVRAPGRHAALVPPYGGDRDRRGLRRRGGQEPARPHLHDSHGAPLHQPQARGARLPGGHRAPCSRLRTGPWPWGGQVGRRPTRTCSPVKAMLSRPGSQPVLPSATDVLPARGGGSAGPRGPTTAVRGFPQAQKSGALLPKCAQSAP
jgi:hypothetical protein